MKAGRELDVLIAQKVMKLIVNLAIGACEYIDNDGLYEIPHYSTCIQDAWKVVEKLTQEWRFRLTHDFKRPNDERPYRAAFCKWGTKAHRAYADTAPLAICLAALKAVQK